MFWRVASGSVASPIVAILDTEYFTLKDLLREDDIFQELQLCNQQLLEYLLQESVLEELMRFVVGPADQVLIQEEKYKYACAASEVLCCSKSEKLLDGVVEHPKLFEILFETHPTDSITANCFARVVAHLFTHRSGPLLDWLMEHREVLEGMTERLEFTGVAETLVRLAGADDQTSSSASQAQLVWVRDTRVLPSLLAKLESEGAADAAETAAEVLTAIARAKGSPLTQLLGSKANLEWLVKWAVSAPVDPPLIQALNVCIALVERRRLWEVAHGSGLASTPADTDRALEVQAVETLAPHLPRLFSHLSERQAGKTQETPHGLLQPPLGSGRLTVVALLAVLLRTGLPAAEEAVMNAHLLRLCLSLFADYPFNSILHHQVTSIISNVLESGSDALLACLLEECGLLTWLVKVPTEVTPVSCRAEAKEPKSLQAGYTGHLTQIGNRLVAAAETRSLLREHMAAHEGWQAFAADRLAEANQMEDVHAWGCGRPAANTNAECSEGEENLYAEMNGEYSSLARFQAAFESDSDSDDETLSRADLLFADAPDRTNDDENDFTTSTAFQEVVSELVTASAVDCANKSSKLMSRRTRNLVVDEDDGAPQTSGEDGAEDSPIPNSWEDLALDGEDEEFPVHRLVSRPAPGHASARADADDMPGPRVVGFASAAVNGSVPFPFLGTSPPTGRSSLHTALQSSILSEELPAASGSGAVGESPPAVDLAELRQPGSPFEPLGVDLDGHRAAEPAGGKRKPGTLERRSSKDLETHPYSLPRSMSLEDLKEEVSSTLAAGEAAALLMAWCTQSVRKRQKPPLSLLKSRVAPPEVDKLRLEDLPAAPPDSTSAGDHEEQTLVGSFTKLGDNTILAEAQK